jgi:hypothetical protein
MMKEQSMDSSVAIAEWMDEYERESSTGGLDDRCARTFDPTHSCPGRHQRRRGRAAGTNVVNAFAVEPDGLADIDLQAARATKSGVVVRRLDDRVLQRSETGFGAELELADA